MRGSSSSLLIALAVLTAADATATKRALFVGIKTYAIDETERATLCPAPIESASTARGTWEDLDGPLNDVVAMREVLIARYGFERRHVHELTERAATREAILAAIERELILPSQPGDVAVFYYAGHGSQVVNTLNGELDQKDETLVPADAACGQRDIRDKELRALFHRVVQKGVALTIIFDSCHSGSAARGRIGKRRQVPADPRDVREAPDASVPAPEDEGALVLSAAQDHQSSWEAVDDAEQPRGAFSLALATVLRTASPTASASEVFLQVRARMQAEAMLQEPALAGKPERRRAPLFGGVAGEGRTTVAVLRSEGKRVELQGGLAVGLAEGTELVKHGAASPKLRVVKVIGLAEAEAEVVEGVAAVATGDLFDVARWAPPGGASLRVWIPPSAPRAAIERLARELAPLRATPTWVDDPTETTPTHVLSWDGRAWRLGGEKVAALTAIASKLGPTSKLFVAVPPLRDAMPALGPDVAVATKRADAHYELLGRLGAGGPEYAWALPDTSRAEAEDRALPVRTTFGPTDALTDLASRLGRIRAWLVLEPPPDDDRFPYRLALKNTKTGALVSDGAVHAGESYGLVLHADPKRLEGWVERRYIYVFVVDSGGKSQLMFPDVGAGNVGNSLPIADAVPEIAIGPRHLFTISPPLGVDTWFLLSTPAPIGEPAVLEQDGVKRDAVRSEAGTLQSLLARVGTKSRGADKATPADWSLQRFSLRSK